MTMNSKRSLLQWAGLTAVAATMALVGCGKKEEPKATAPAAAANAEEKVLNIYNWPDYIAKDLIANFEKDTGIKVNYQTFENNEGLQAFLNHVKQALSVGQPDGMKLGLNIGKNAATPIERAVDD